MNRKEKIMKYVLTVLLVLAIFMTGLSLGVGVGKAVALSRGTPTKFEKLQEEIDSIYSLIEGSNQTLMTVMGTQYRMYHYIAGHDFRQPVTGCDECGLIKELDYRRKVIDNELATLSRQVAEAESWTDTEPLVDRINALTIEADIVAQHIHNSSERAKSVGDFMKHRAEMKGKF